jgi:hypothetical protein
MNSPENKGYWTEQIGVFQREIAEIEAFLNNNQNAVSTEGENTSETMADAETDLMQTKSALRHAKIELARIERQEEIAALLPQIKEAKMKVAHRLSQSDTEEANVFREIQERLEARVRELQQDPVISEEE